MELEEKGPERWEVHRCLLRQALAAADETNGGPVYAKQWRTGRLAHVDLARRVNVA